MCDDPGGSTDPPPVSPCYFALELPVRLDQPSHFLPGTADSFKLVGKTPGAKCPLIARHSTPLYPPPSPPSTVLASNSLPAAPSSSCPVSPTVASHSPASPPTNAIKARKWTPPQLSPFHADGDRHNLSATPPCAAGLTELLIATHAAILSLLRSLIPLCPDYLQLPGPHTVLHTPHPLTPLSNQAAQRRATRSCSLPTHTHSHTHTHTH